ncbi:MAG TPA: NAD(P)-binding domain-containing protein [Nocardioidaceae bacterium]|nr:NAD(P)-binding domain-containing protein [Nocardioidaceae bacterium]
MKMAVLGTGSVGRTVAPALTRLGHQVAVGTRDPETTRRRSDWAPLPDDVPLRSYATVADGVDLVVNATNGMGSLAALAAVGAERLAGRVLLDLSNPLDFSAGFPPTLSVKDTDSLAEQIARAFPDVRVVKALNTVTAAVMVDPTLVGEGDTTVFAASDDAEARTIVVGLLRDLGWRDVVELDELAAARGLEMYLPLWVRLVGALGTAAFNVKLVR